MVQMRCNARFLQPCANIETATTTIIVRPRKMQRNPRESYTNYGKKCQETFVYTEGHSTTNSGRNTAREMIQICPAENAETNPGKWTRDSGGAPSSGQTLPYPHPSVNPTVKRGGTTWMTADRHHSPPDQINRRLKCHGPVTFPSSLPHSAFSSTTHRTIGEFDLACCQPPIRHKGAHPRY